ncbi:MAG: pilT [Herbaspirillum sp.]|jgi:twitching motility protein PilT|nr:pilT [Herbaspirillum sp.]
MNISELLSRSLQSRASDLHLSAGMPPLLRVNGEMARLALPALSHAEVHAMLHGLMNDTQRRLYGTRLECDFSFSVSDTARFRVNAFNQIRGAAAVIRTIPADIPTLAHLAAPELFGALALKRAGLILVTGATGSGKSTTLAAMIDHINRHRSAHVLTIEDPVEFVHPSQRSLVNQREIGRDTASFSGSLRAALREDPDVIMIGELRDPDSIRLALSAAETGHLVLGTLHTGSAVKAVDRIVDVFPGDEQHMVRAMLSESIQGVIAQMLMPRSDGDGRVAAYEIMLGTPAIRNLIREGKTAQMYSALQTGSGAGMQTLDQHLTQLVRQRIVSAATARAAARHPECIPE